MRASIRKWMVVGGLAAAALWLPGCKNTSDQGAPGGQGAGGGMQTETGTGGAGYDQQGGTGGAGGGTHKGTKGTTGGGTMAQDAGTPPPADAGTGGAGLEGQDFDSQGGNTGGIRK
jgi:hypothetical protein